ncbi:TetR/AcrR family transcriptional regulator [Ornithinimicrobium avium]|uniref:TetR family transcriptional regulator n=1 Tax=Ornithinimicrobium avium TaxID=2283195 RepID=A0A345NQ17_9MICO|nr:TetR/AcrR family transcriptional regulator C-terminal domain-containing protein [Ornithinimicrobium avium]AXH97125.1 TetR family transcriptional regulator [Ornithinimicrobium avium]
MSQVERDGLVRAALELIDQGGPQAVSLRVIAGQAGVPVEQLYRVVSGREELLDVVVAELVSRIEGPLEEGMARTWQGYLQALGHRVREVMVMHPRAFPLLVTSPPAAPWLRPPLRSLIVVEDLLAHLVGHGFSDEEAVQAYQGFSSFLLGHLLLEAPCWVPAPGRSRCRWTRAARACRARTSIARMGTSRT